MQKYTIGIISDAAENELTFCDRELFTPIVSSSFQDIITADGIDLIHLLVIDQVSHPNWDDVFYNEVKNYFAPLGIPVVLIVDNEISFANKIDALEIGFSDVINIHQPLDEISTRMMGEVYHQIANMQLKSVIQQANDAAFSAMKESSNLGQNIRFLLRTHSCDDLNQLGQVFFQTVNEYGLNCSLQMRSEFGVRNMEANGMERVLESELLSKLQNHGRYFDFGQRCVVNYGTVSVLIRNMPEDENLYGMIKDNTFTLLQGLDARVIALDEHQQLQKEKETLEQLSEGVTFVMKGIEADFHSVMLKIVDVVESMAENIECKIPTLMLNEEQEEYVLNVVGRCVSQSNQVFSEGLHIDEHFEVLIRKMEETRQQAVRAAEIQQVKKLQMAERNVVGSDIELF
ncbi:MAG: hypothetical protein V3T17_06180 [Pseudomonadales bacterium]